MLSRGVPETSLTWGGRFPDPYQREREREREMVSQRYQHDA